MSSKIFRGRSKNDEQLPLDSVAARSHRRRRSLRWVYPYLADSTAESRRAWHDSLQLIAALQSRVVVAGHKKNAGVPDSPQAIASMEKYLDDFESARKAASNADQLVAAMKQSTLILREKSSWSFQRKQLSSPQHPNDVPFDISRVVRSDAVFFSMRAFHRP
jgi:hypothetical protein